jgi:hypothetical protein
MAVQPQLGLRRQWDHRVPVAARNPWLAVQVVLSVPKKWMMTLVLAGMLLAACSTGGTEVVPTQVQSAVEDALPPDVALSVQNEVSRVLGVASEQLKIQQIEKKDWQDACLGLPQGNEVCAQTITPGWLLTFNVNNQTYRFRVDQTGTIIRQEP